MSEHGWSNLYIDFLAEFTNGCRWNCAGCGVMKEAQRLPTASEMLKINSVFDEFQSSGYELDHFEIGPTDFMVSENLEEIFSRADIMDTCARFNMLVLQSPFLELRPRAVELLNQYVKNPVINLYIVIDFQHVDNEKYLSTVRRNLDLFRDQLKAKIGRIDVAFNSTPGSKKTLHQAIAQTKQYFGTIPWHVVSSSRSNDLAKAQLRIKKDISWLNEVFNSTIRPGKDWDVNFQYGNRIKPTNRAYVWSAGKWFWPPILYGHFVNYDPSFQIPEPITLGSIQEWEQQMLVKQYAGIEQKRECQDCEHLGQCANQGILTLMDALQEKSCICPKEAFNVYRGAVV